MFLRPDWTNPKQYEKLLRMNAYPSIAWEFLRRNSDYAADLERLTIEIVERGIGCDEEPSQVLIAALSEPPKLYAAFLEFSSKAPSFYREWNQHFIDKWRMNTAISCEDSEGEEFFICTEVDLPGLFEEAPPFGGQLVTPYLLIPVDLSQPLEAIEARLLSRVRYLRKRGLEDGAFTAKKARVLAQRVYVDQLRILDGFHSGATAREIGNVLQPKAANDDNSLQRDKRIKAAHKAALKMQNGGYRALL